MCSRAGELASGAEGLRDARLRDPVRGARGGAAARAARARRVRVERRAVRHAVLRHRQRGRPRPARW